MAYSIVKVTPTVDTSAYADGDVLFVNTEFSLPARHAKLINGFVIDKEKQLAADDVSFFFFRENVANLGTINATANISDADFMSNDFIGAVNILEAVETADLDNLLIHSMTPYGGVTDSAASTGRDLSIVMRSSSTPSTANAYPVYVTAFFQVVDASAPNFTATDALELVLHFEY